MIEILDEVDRWRRKNRRIAVARVVDIEGSGPRDPGAAMAVNEDGEVAGSVSGGCVEGAVVAEALSILAGERSAGVITFGYSDDEAFSVGLTCGGTIHLFIEEARLVTQGVYELWRDAVRAERPVALATVIDGPDVGRKLLVGPDRSAVGSLGNDDLDRVVTRDALAGLDMGITEVRHYGLHGEARQADISVFIESRAKRPQMLIFGAVDFTRALAEQARLLGYRVTVCDAREVFATRKRFPMADEVVVDWPNRLLDRVGADLGPRDAVCVLTHDAKFDVPAITAALATRVGYIGAMGSRTTHERRSERLREEGVTDAELDRVMAPIGIDIGARSPEETAVSICAEIIALRTDRPTSSLKDGSGAIH